MKVKEKAKKLKVWISNHSDSIIEVVCLSCIGFGGGLLGYAIGSRCGADDLYNSLKDGFIKSYNQGLITCTEDIAKDVAKTAEEYAEDSLCSILIMHQIY